MPARYWFLIILLGTIWGSSFFFNAILNPELDPLWISAGRVGLGAAFSWFMVAVLRRKVLGPSFLYVHLFVLGTLSYAIPFALFPISQQALPSGAAAILNAFMPLMTVVVAHFWPNGEKATWNKVLGVLAGLAGVGVLAAPSVMSGGSAEIWAVALCLLATLCYALAVNYTKSFSHIDPFIMAAYALTGATVSATLAAVLAHGAPGAVSLQGWGALLGIGILSTGIAFQIMYRIIPVIGPTNMSVTTFIAPVSAIILGTLFLNEQLQWSHFVGMAFIFLGLLLIDGRIMRKNTTQVAINE